MEERWKDIKGFEDKYKISSEGIIINKYNEIRVKPRTSKDGYLNVSLYYNKKVHFKSIHRLVAETFKEKDINIKLEVNHIDGNKLNNKIDNLEWVTHKENINHAWRTGLFEPVRKASRRYGKDNPISKRIQQYDLNGRLLKEWDCIMDAVRETGINKTNIGKCCNGRRKRAGGFVWKFTPHIQ